MTKMVSTAQQVDNTKGRNMNYVFETENKAYIFLYQILFLVHQFNKILSSELPNFTAKLTIH